MNQGYIADATQGKQILYIKPEISLLAIPGGVSRAKILAEMRANQAAIELEKKTKRKRRKRIILDFEI